jgi:hypothetical protein
MKRSEIRPNSRSPIAPGFHFVQSGLRLLNADAAPTPGRGDRVSPQIQSISVTIRRPLDSCRVPRNQVAKSRAGKVSAKWTSISWE